jgi:hypothetical protein
VRADGQPEYRLHHDAIRTHIAGALGAAALRRCHQAPDRTRRRARAWRPGTRHGEVLGSQRSADLDALGDLVISVISVISMASVLSVFSPDGHTP